MAVILVLMVVDHLQTLVIQQFMKANSRDMVMMTCFTVALVMIPLTVDLATMYLMAEEKTKLIGGIALTLEIL